MYRAGFVLVCLFVAACGSDSPVAPTAPAPPPPPVIPACQSTHTASVTFGNRSQGTTQDIFWDGLKVATITPGSNSAPITVAAGVAHNLQTRITNTTLLACAVSAPVPAECSNPLYTCAFP